MKVARKRLCVGEREFNVKVLTKIHPWIAILAMSL